MDIQAEVARITNAHLASLGLTPERLKAIQNGIAPQEAIALPPFVPVKKQPLPSTEIECDVMLGSGFVIGMNLRVWARFHKFHKGYRDGGDQIDPDEPAHWEVIRVCVGYKACEVEITECLSADDLGEIEDYLLENVTPDGEDE